MGTGEGAGSRAIEAALRTLNPVVGWEDFRERVAQFDGGELTNASSAIPYAVVFPPLHARSIVYTTKSSVAGSLFVSADDVVPIGIIARYGLPRVEDFEGIARVVRDFQVYFLGDCDPFDLLVFAWLRQYLSIHFLGTSDSVVAALGVDINEQIMIPLSDEEKLAMSLLRELWPDYAASIGPNCARMLDGNRKLELEALASFRRCPIDNLLQLLTK